MKFPMDRPVKIVMLGAGGTGGYIAPYLYRLLHMLDRPARFVICDGDIVELKNLDRQNFVPADLGENKARILAERYSTVLGMETEYVPNFIETLPELMALTGDVGGNVVIRAHPESLLLYETAAAELRDVDTVEALAAIRTEKIM